MNWIEIFIDDEPTLTLSSTTNLWGAKPSMERIMTDPSGNRQSQNSCFHIGYFCNTFLTPSSVLLTWDDGDGFLLLPLFDIREEDYDRSTKYFPHRMAVQHPPSVLLTWDDDGFLWLVAAIEMILQPQSNTGQGWWADRSPPFGGQDIGLKCWFSQIWRSRYWIKIETKLLV